MTDASLNPSRVIALSGDWNRFDQVFSVHVATGDRRSLTPIESLMVVAAAQAALTPRNLVATAAVKAQLREAHLKVVPIADRKTVRGPLKGSTYYGSYGSTRYAIATFSRQGLGTQDQPELFSKAVGKPWRDRGDTGGCISSSIVPASLLRLWGFRRDTLNPPCFLP